MALNFQTTTCPHCDGDGCIGDGPNCYRCARCKGAGTVLECTVCRGKGWTSRPSLKHGAPYIDKIECEHCDSTGAEPEGGDDAVR
jgi:hypothetical protein